MQTLKEKLKQQKEFKSLSQEALLSLYVASVHMRQLSEGIFKKYGLTNSYYNVLRILRGAPDNGYPRCEIIDRMIDPAPDVTRLIDQLVKKGWVIRKRSEEDRRVSLHWITAEGLQILTEVEDEVDGIQDSLADCLGKENMEHLVHICTTIFNQVKLCQPE